MGSITHTKVSAIADDPAASTAGEVLPSDWNDVHTFSLTKTDVGLDNVDNTSDANKPVSTATQTALDLKVDENAAITAATKTKITYDAKGLVTAGTDATTADIADSTNKRYVTDAQLTVIGNTSGTNTGDQTSVAGNAGTATALATARTIDGVSFNGTANITVIAPATVAATGKTTPVDADVMPLADSAASNVLKKVTWSNIKATLKTYFDTLYAPIGGSVIRGYINGFGLSYSSTTVLGIAAGYAADSTNAVMITGTAFTKSTAGTWAAGTAGNGMGTGLTIANNTTYHVFAIINAGAFDVYFDTSVSAANAPAGTTAFKRIGSFLTNGSAQIVNFIQVGQKFRRVTNVTAYSGTLSNTPALIAAGVPTGISVEAVFGYGAQDTSPADEFLIWSPLTGATTKFEAYTVIQVNGVYIGGNATILTNTSGQIYAGGGSSIATFQLWAAGWNDLGVAATV